MDILKYCRPEDVGVSPVFVENFIKNINRRRKMLHGFIMIRHGKVFAEGYYKPFDKNWLHRMYSSSKSFVSAAVGMLVDEGRVKLGDPIIKYFPEYDTPDLDPLIREMTIRDMLMMATCHKYSTYTRNDLNWVETFFKPHYEPDHKAGTEFRYDTSATYTLDAMVERLTGKNFLEYLKDKVLRDIGFSEDAWCVNAPDGYAWGGSGVECTLRDLARFMLLFANKGQLNGKRYLSEEYAVEATSKQIDNLNGSLDTHHGHGYGYQFWRVFNNGFATLGMGGQTSYYFPDLDMIFAEIADTQGDADGYSPFVEVFYEEVASKVQNPPLPYDEIAYARLNAIISGLEVNLPAGELSSPILDEIVGRTYTFEENKNGFKSVTFDFAGSQGIITIDTDRGEKHFPVCLGRYSDTTFPEKHYYLKRMLEPSGVPYRCLNAVVFPEPNVLTLRTYVIDAFFGNMTANFTFDGDALKLKITKTAEWFIEEYVGEFTGIRN